MYDRLKLLRKNLGLTQAQLAEKLGISRPYLTEIEKGTRRPTPDFFLSLLVTNVSLDWLFTGEGSMFRASPSVSNTSLEEIILIYNNLPEERQNALLV